MKIIRNTITIADLRGYYKQGQLKINRDYQRSRGLWPNNARSYFIDTILNGFPFPKITLRQKIELKTQKSIREVIDGQQRFTAIIDFIDDKFKLSTVSKKFAKMGFSDLDDELKTIFLSYEVSVDTAMGSTDEEVIDIFRRINSYTVPLNMQEKRHAKYQGEFKWFIRDMIERYSPLFEKYKILTPREIARMNDADLLTELSQLILSDGLIGRSVSKLENIYKDNDNVFPDRQLVEFRLCTTLDFIKNELVEVLELQILNGFLLYSLVSALIYNKWGISNVSMTDPKLIPIGQYLTDKNQALEKISLLLTAFSEKDQDDRYKNFVTACIQTTQSSKNRLIRCEYFVQALQ